MGNNENSIKDWIPDINTRRLVLKEMIEEDTDIVVRLRSDPDIYKYFFSAHKLTAIEHIKWYRNQYLYDKNRYDYVARIKENYYAIGVFGIKKIEKNVVEISYILNQLYRGKGYAYEAVSALLEFVNKEWGCETVVAKIHKNNKTSIHFAENLGLGSVLQEGNFITYSKQL